MPNRFTRVPDAPMPPPTRLPAAVLTVADLFMVAMLSRPPSGTLRTTWVTPSTYWMAIGSALGTVLLAVALLGGAIRERGPVTLAAAILCLAFAAGSGAVALVGADQRLRAARRRPGSDGSR